MQTFRELREKDCYYVDKTAYVERLVHEGKHYFLSRPRRFGKSLFLDTLKELFEGNEALFAGLHIHDGWRWSASHPVVRLDFAGGHFAKPAHLHANVSAQLDGIEMATGVTPRYDTAPERFGYLLRSLHERTGRRVAVLVDEYDKPILDALVETPALARANRDYLAGLYGVIKANDAHVHFTFLTGVSKFSKVNLFSQLNNLTDITLDPVYSSICGYTEGDLDTVFAPEITGLDRERVREWYNGYNWLGPEKVYNPYDVLLLMRRGTFAAHWFETGTPAFLVETLCKRRVSSVSLGDTVRHGGVAVGVRRGAQRHGGPAVPDRLSHDRGRRGAGRHGAVSPELSYPNREVRQSLNEHLLRHLVQDAERQTANSMRLHRLLAAHDCSGLKDLFHAFFASIPYEWYTNNDIARYEGYYASVFYSYFAALGYEIAVEDSTSHGRLDMAVLSDGHVTCSSSR